MHNKLKNLFKRPHARTLAVISLLATTALFGAPSLARVEHATGAASCSGTTPNPKQDQVVIKVSPLQVDDVTVDPTAEEVVWSCPHCPGDFAVIFNQTLDSPFKDYIFSSGSNHSGCPITQTSVDDQAFSYIVYVGNHYLDPQVIIKGTGPTEGRRKKDKGAK
jgi:hypothetical protein